MLGMFVRRGTFSPTPELPLTSPPSPRPPHPAGPEVCLVLSEALRHNDSLENLQLNGNPLGADGGRHLMWGLHISSSLKVLGCQDCVFASDGPVGGMVGYGPPDHLSRTLYLRTF